MPLTENFAYVLNARNQVKKFNILNIAARNLDNTEAFFVENSCS